MLDILQQMLGNSNFFGEWVGYGSNKRLILKLYWWFFRTICKMHPSNFFGRKQDIMQQMQTIQTLDIILDGMQRMHRILTSLDDYQDNMLPTPHTQISLGIKLGMTFTGNNIGSNIIIAQIYPLAMLLQIGNEHWRSAFRNRV